MKSDNHNRQRRQGATPGFRVLKRLSQSIIGEAEGKNRVQRRVTSKNGGVGIVYVGPSVEGGDKEYVKVLTGDVDRRMPSFINA